MLKKLSISILSFVLLITLIPFVNPAQAASVYKGTFEGVTYTEVELKDGTVERTNAKVTIRNSSGRTTTFNLLDTTYYYVNGTVSTIDAFKKGMEVTATVNLRSVSRLEGKSDIEQGAIVENSKQLTGIVTKIDPNGMFVRVKLDTGIEKQYYLNSDTEYVKGKSHVDISTMYEGDRVKLKLSSASSSVVSEIEIIQVGTLIHNLYKAELSTVNTRSNKLTVANAHPFEDWEFGTRPNSNLQSVTFTNHTTIYAGNKKITKNQLSYYHNSDIYYVTKKQYGRELIEKIVVLEDNERTFYDQITTVDTTNKFFRLKNFGLMYYHDGSILVRNGRLVEPTTLTAWGTAFVLTDGVTKSNYTHIVNITNDSFLSPNLATHELYFGQLSLVEQSNYLLELADYTRLEAGSHAWVREEEDAKTLSFSNSTVVTRSFGGSDSVLVTNLEVREGMYGYFYVKDGHLQAIHLVGKDKLQPTVTLAGRIASVNVINPGSNGIDATAEMEVKDVSQWYEGAWLDTGRLNRIELDQVLIIKDRKRITVDQLKPNDRVVILTDDTFDAQVILVNE
ncbi:hypothetical protein AAGS61_06985 [Lysinibacillus sp. KU-BSD001]|uniref:hypothetical protein n=1 Tax=Lysinibacillus sp. KU-BSD001 TaxID=3141328 RepID=UPI0036E5EAEC